MMYTLESRIIVRAPLIVNFSIFFYPGHLYSSPSPITIFQPFLLTFLGVNSHFQHSSSQRKRNCTVWYNYYELRKHEIHAGSVRSHSG